MSETKRLLAEEDIKAINEGRFNRPLTRDETVEYIDSFGTMTYEEVLEWSDKKIDELWEKKYGNIQ